MTESTACRTGPRLRPGHASAVVPAAGPPPGWPGITWLVRPAGTHGTRPALEVYVAGTLADVLVATPLARAVLGGGRAVPGRADRAVAWGRQTGDGLPDVEFRFRPGRGRPRPAVVTAVGRRFWVAMADGRFASVTATYRDGAERLRLRRVRP